jgi:hypothetical protein
MAVFVFYKESNKIRTIVIFVVLGRNRDIRRLNFILDYSWHYDTIKAVWACARAEVSIPLFRCPVWAKISCFGRRVGE